MLLNEYSRTLFEYFLAPLRLRVSLLVLSGESFHKNRHEHCENTDGDDNHRFSKYSKQFFGNKTLLD